MPTIQVFYAICSPGMKMTWHVHGIIVSVVQNSKIHSKYNLRELIDHAVRASKFRGEDGSYLTSFAAAQFVTW